MKKIVLKAFVNEENVIKLLLIKNVYFLPEKS